MTEFELNDFVEVTDACQYPGIVGVRGILVERSPIGQWKVRVKPEIPEFTFVYAFENELRLLRASYNAGVVQPSDVDELVEHLHGTPDTKPTNPKDAIGSSKLPLSLWPETATAYGCLGLLEGALKYGRLNWRDAGVRASIYVDALRRHIGAWFEGEDVAPDSGLPHLAHALACLAILVDAETAGKLVDDRQFNGAGYRPLVESLTPHVKRLQERYVDFNPKHYTAADNTPDASPHGGR